MSVLYILLLASLGVALIFLGAFLWAVRGGQFDDTFTPAWRVLTDDEGAEKQPSEKLQKSGKELERS